MTIRSALAAAFTLVLAPGALVGCGEAVSGDATPSAEVAADDRVQLVENGQADLVLHVSNQSFDDAVVRLRVAVDGVTVIDDEFQVKDQHHWISFPLSMSPGPHQIEAKADSGATLTKSFRVPGDDQRFAVLDHWGKGDSSELTWSFHRKPVHFA